MVGFRERSYPVGMRLWSLHPRHLDRRGLVACWREALLAQAVLLGRTKGYRHHPQLERFRDRPDPAAAVAEYLRGLHAEASARGYSFDGAKIRAGRDPGPLAVTRGQLRYEWDWLRAKVAGRDPGWLPRLEGSVRPRAHPLFRVVAGDVEPWERV